MRRFYGSLIAFFLFCSSPLQLLEAQECGTGNFDNLIVNGDFGSGDDSISFDTSAFKSNQLFTTDVPPFDGFYTLTNNTSTWGRFADQFWINIGDNSTDPTGYMMVVNQGGDSLFYEQEIPICAGASYYFSVDMINIYEPNENGGEVLPDIELWINGEREANLGIVEKNASWSTFSHRFIAPTSDTILLQLKNKSPSGEGDDFAMDNLVLQFCPPGLDLRLSNNQTNCPGDDILLEVSTNDNDNSTGLSIQLELSLDGGDSWTPSRPPTTVGSIDIENIPPNASYRLRAAFGLAQINNPNCFFYSNIVNIVYTNPEECNEVIESIGELCEGSRGDNIFEDGTFGAGSANIFPTNPGLAPGYGYQTSPPPNDGFYTITNNTSSWGSFANAVWVNIPDNSEDPNGYMMVVNAAFEPGIFYEETVPVCENTNYEFSADVINLIQPGVANHIAPNLSFSINGQEVYTSGNVPQDGEWHTYGFTFTTRFGTEAIQLTLRNNAPGGIGNDLALDNITFRPCGPKVSLADTTEVCFGEAQILEADVSLDEDFPNLALQWQKSTTEGLLWEDIPDEQDSTLLVEDPVDGEWYRLKIANRTANLNNSSCQFFSNITALFDASGRTDLVDTLCLGEERSIEGNRFDSTGYYEVLIPLDNGCDSLVTLDLLINPTYDQDMEIVICENDTFLLGDQILSTQGQFSQLFQSQDGCDSLVNIDLLLEPEYQFTDTTILCFGEAFEGRIYFEDTLTFEPLLTQAGCDSILATYFKILPSQNQTFVRLVCPGDSFNGTTVNNDTLVSVGGFNGITCDSVTLYELQLFDDPNPEIEGPELICDDQVAELKVDGFANYEWSTGAESTSINVAESGNYSVTLTSSNNCLYRDSTDLRVVALEASLSSKEVNCFGESNGAILINTIQGGDLPYTMRFNGGPLQEPGDIIDIAAGTYTLEFQEANGCDYLETVTIEEPDLFTIELTPDQNIILGESIQLEVIGSRTFDEVSWTPEANLSCTDCPDPVASPVNNIIYEVFAKDNAGCEAFGAIRFTVEKNRRVFLPNAFSPNGDDINDVFKPFMANNIERVLQFVILDRWGNLIKKVEDLSPDDIQLEWDGFYRGNSAPTGTYIWSIEVEFKDQVIRRYSGDVLLIR